MVRLNTKVGMFWCVGETVIGEAVPLSQAEPYGDALQHGAHYDFWRGLKPQTIAERQLKSHAYDYYPRWPGGLLPVTAAVSIVRGWLCESRKPSGSYQLFWS